MGTANDRTQGLHGFANQQMRFTWRRLKRLPGAWVDQALVITPDVSSGYDCMLTHRSLFGFRSGPQLQQVRVCGGSVCVDLTLSAC